jgi:hypothetical protein
MPNFTKLYGKVLDINRKIFAQGCLLYALKDSEVRGYEALTVGTDTTGKIPRNWNVEDLGDAVPLYVSVAAIGDVTKTVLGNITMFGYKRSDESVIKVYKVMSVDIARLPSNDVWKFRCAPTGETFS